MYETWSAIHTARFWGAEIVALTAAGSFAGWESAVQHWSPIETAVFTTLIVIGMALIIVVLIYGGSWLLAWPRQRNEARQHIEHMQSGYLEIEVAGLGRSVGRIDRTMTGLELKGDVIGIILVVTNTSDTTPVAIRKINVARVRDGQFVGMPKKVNAFNSADSRFIDEESLMKGPPLDETAYLRPHETTRGVLNYADAVADKGPDWYLFVEDSFGNDYQAQLAPRYDRKAVRITSFPWRSTRNTEADSPQPTP
jgi:hypothetical protein